MAVGIDDDDGDGDDELESLDRFEEVLMATAAVVSLVRELGRPPRRG